MLNGKRLVSVWRGAVDCPGDTLVAGLESSMLMEIGHVEEIFRYPVKSMRGERLDAADLGWHGLDGDRRPTGNPTVQEAEAAFEAIWQTRGPVDHGFAADYRQLASRLISALVRSGTGRRFRDAQALAIDLPGGRVIVEPDEMAELPNGTVVLRRVRTGQKRSDEYDRLEYTLYQLAGESHFARGFEIQALHLTDEISEPVQISSKKLQNRRANSDAMLSKISAGSFPVQIDAVTCPRCPHFFVCAAVPKGPLVLP